LPVLENITCPSNDPSQLCAGLPVLDTFDTVASTSNFVRTGGGTMLAVGEEPGRSLETVHCTELSISVMFNAKRN
jgi:hypothetical protein